MYVIHINASYKPAWIYGGPTHSVSKLCESIVSNCGTESIQLEVLTTTANGSTELNVPTGVVQWVDGVKITYFRRMTKDHSHFSPQLLKHLNEKINLYGKNNIVIHIHAWWNLVSILTALLAKLKGVKYIVSPRGMLTEYTLKNKHSLIKRLFHNLAGKHLIKSAVLHTTSNLEFDIIKQFIAIKNHYSIFNVVDFPEYNPPKDDITGQFKILFLSRIDEKKGLEFLFKALSNIKFDWVLEIAGTGVPLYIQKLKKLSEELSIHNKISWLGQLNNTEKFHKLKNSDLLCLTSYNENFANVVVECLSQGTPVLLSKYVGLKDFVEHHNLGWICELNVDSIQKTITTAYRDTEKRIKINETAAEIINNAFDPKILSKQYFEMYSNIMGKNELKTN